ncbi:hypothetical protein F1880_006488 [Penicillium rolfsii]|nr:hypothetical protein F1880_006488 [Penicillium rolfsii]
MPPFFRLPPELHVLIATFLPIEDYLQFRLTCAYLYDVIPAPSQEELLLAESTNWARRNDIYTCRYCLRLRPARQFAESMLRRRRSREGRDSNKRFCVDCGLKPRNGTARYGPGAHVIMQGKFYVVCLSCGTFQPGAIDFLGRHTSYCVNCSS